MTLSSNQTLNYQLYFFLQTYRRKKDEYIAEPLDLKDDNSFIHFSQDKDKRLFRFDVTDRPLAEFGSDTQGSGEIFSQTSEVLFDLGGLTSRILYLSLPNARLPKLQLNNTPAS